MVTFASCGVEVIRLSFYVDRKIALPAYGVLLDFSRRHISTSVIAENSDSFEAQLVFFFLLMVVVAAKGTVVLPEMNNHGIVRDKLLFAL